MAPPPCHGVSHHHEAGDVIDHIVHPSGAKGRAMAAFVPAAVAGRPVDHAVDEKERHAGPGAPEVDATPSAADQQGKPDRRVAQGRAIGAFHQVFHHGPRHLGMIPFCRGEANFHGPSPVCARQAVIAFSNWDGCCCHHLTYAAIGPKFGAVVTSPRLCRCSAPKSSAPRLTPERPQDWPHLRPECGSLRFDFSG